MRRIVSLVAGLGLVAAVIAPLASIRLASATSLAGETFTGVSTAANQWTSGGSGGSVACLTAATSSATNSIPACSGGPIDSVGNGVLRLTPNVNTRSGFVFYNTPVSASEGLQIEFDMYQYGGSGADGISFFLIDGAASPTQPGASGGSLGYSSTTGTAGLVGGYVGVGFDRFGNFSNSGFGAGGTGRVPNSVTVRGAEATDYQFVTTHPASGALAVEASPTRTSAKRHVVVSVSTNNVMTVAVNYGSGLVTELQNINLNTINGAGSLPASFKFGWAASTGGSNNTHEISGLTVSTLRPKLGMNVTNGGGFQQGETGQYTLAVSNDAGAEATSDTITVTDTLPTGITPTGVSGSGWSCTIAGQLVTCTRPGSGGSALAAGASAPNITINVAIAASAAASVNNTATVATANNDTTNASDTDTASIAPSADQDGIADSVETAAPNNGDANNDGIADKSQVTVTSLPNPVTSSYAVLETNGCTGNNSVSIDTQNTGAGDGSYSYPAGLMDFTLTCGTPGATTTVTMYYYGLDYSPNLSLRKYNATTHTYTTVPGASFASVTIGGKQATKITYQITDGGPLDQDGSANGTIVDPAGPALLAPSVSAPSTGLQRSTLLPYYASAIVGTILLAYEVRKRTHHHRH